MTMHIKNLSQVQENTQVNIIVSCSEDFSNMSLS